MSNPHHVDLTDLIFSLHLSLFFANATIDYHNFWEVLWSVGVTNFILKFIFMGFKCLILLVPCPLMTYRRRVSENQNIIWFALLNLNECVLHRICSVFPKGQWYMLIEEVGQLYQVIAPVPLWFRYLVSYDEIDTSVGLTLGILLALLYLIMKVRTVVITGYFWN